MIFFVRFHVCLLAQNNDKIKMKKNKKTLPQKPTISKTKPIENS